MILDIINKLFGAIKIMEGTVFNNYGPTASKTHYVGYSRNSILKVEVIRNDRKLLSLAEEIEVIMFLNSQGCVSCPLLISHGLTSKGETYMILERIYQQTKCAPADYLISLLEQKSMGCYQGDFKPENMVFDGNICYLIDYDQAQRSEDFVSMRNVEFIDWIAGNFKKSRGSDFWSNNERKFNRDEWLLLFKNDSFFMNETSLLNNQNTTNTESGVYHQITLPQVFTEGSRGFEKRKVLLDQMVFLENEKILDVGCNLGLVSSYFYDRGCDVTGVDLDENVIKGAKIISNINNKNIRYVREDMGCCTLIDYFDTVVLFSVFHHIDDIKKAAQFISSHSKRVILECKLKEYGSKPIKGKWVKTTTWECSNEEELIKYIEGLLFPMKYDKTWGETERDRHLFTFVRL